MYPEEKYFSDVPGSCLPDVRMNAYLLRRDWLRAYPNMFNLVLNRVHCDDFVNGVTGSQKMTRLTIVIKNPS